MSFCDFFSCIFAILNVLEYIPPPYLDSYSNSYRKICLSISLYTHPIATTLQALSVWIICAFSIHRSRSIIKPSIFLSPAKNSNESSYESHGNESNKARLKVNSSNHSTSVITSPLKYLTNLFQKLKGNTARNNSNRNYFFHIDLKNNCSKQSYELKLYTNPMPCLNTKNKTLKKFCFYCFCTCKSKYKPDFDTYLPNSSSTYNYLNPACNSSIPKAENESSNANSSIQFDQNASNNIAHGNANDLYFNFLSDNRSKKSSLSNAEPKRSFLSRLDSSRCTIFILYATAIVYLVPQMFEKKLSHYHIFGKVYTFTTITKFGKMRWFRQIFHLWFYLFAVYIIPFLLIFVFNLLLLRAFFNSKKRCLRYKLKSDPNVILKDMNSYGSTTNANEESHNVNNKSPNPPITNMRKLNSNLSIVDFKDGTKLAPPNSLIAPECSSGLSQTKYQFTRKSSIRIKSFKQTNRNRALTITLFGVVAIFFLCHFPAAIAKIIYVLFPQIEFEEKSKFAAICLDISNFLIMLNSSINFVLYIVFGPGKFREEFSIIFFTLFSCFTKFFHKSETIKNSNTSNSIYGYSKTNDRLTKKFSMSNSEFNFNANASTSASVTPVVVGDIPAYEARHQHNFNVVLVEEINNYKDLDGI